MSEFVSRLTSAIAMLKARCPNPRCRRISMADPAMVTTNCPGCHQVLHPRRVIDGGVLFHTVTKEPS